MREEKRRLNEEQEELRLDGLRILARLIVRAHLASQTDDVARSGVGGALSDTGPARKLLGKNDGHAL